MSIAAIRRQIETAFSVAYVGAAPAPPPTLPWENGYVVCTPSTGGDYDNSDIDNGADSLCTDAPDYNSPAFDAGTAQWDNADVQPRSAIEAVVSIPVIYDNVQEEPPGQEFVVLSITFPSFTEPVICFSESNVEYIRGTVQVACYSPRAEGMLRLEQMASIAMQTLVGLKAQPDPGQTKVTVGAISGPTSVLSGDQPLAMVNVAAPFTAKG